MFCAKVTKMEKYMVVLNVSKLCKPILRVCLPIAFFMKYLAIYQASVIQGSTRERNNTLHHSGRDNLT